MTSRSVARTPSIGWLRAPGFDLSFIVGTTAIAVASGSLVLMDSRLFAPILLLDLWLLGYHHVISTYTRLCFDRTSARQNRFLILWLPFLVLGGTLAVALGLGLWAIGSIYLYWQWFHYTRQSWGISQIYRRKSDGLVSEGEGLTKAMFYLLPLWGILHRSWQAPEKFLGIEVRVIPVSELLVDVVAFAAIGVLAVWVYYRARAFWRGDGPIAHTLYIASHITIFAIGYLIIEDVTYGWLVINIWHNAQYIFFVWFYNASRFRSGNDEKAVFLSTISQPGNWWLYLAVCLAFTTLLYGAIAGFGEFLIALGLPSMIIVYQTINFHHYIVDSLIWKSRKKPLQKTLGLIPEPSR